MSFSIPTATGGSEVLAAAGADQFADAAGRLYNAAFDGSRVIFSCDQENFPGQWVLGTPPVSISRTRVLLPGFTLTFYDHGPAPQRLHALWHFQGTLDVAVAAWRQAGYMPSQWESRFSRNHPAAIHLRTRGARWTGADSAHVTIPLEQPSMSETCGQIHVGEFNPWIGWGIGLLLHCFE